MSRLKRNRPARVCGIVRKAITLIIAHLRSGRWHVSSVQETQSGATGNELAEFQIIQ